MTRKQHLAIEIHKTVRIHCEVVSIMYVFSEKLRFRSQHTNCVTFYDDVISFDVSNKEQLYQSFDNRSSSKNVKP